MPLSWFDLFLWVAGFAGECMLLFILWRRGQAAEYPLFSSFIFFNALRTIFLACVWRYSLVALYKQAYWQLLFVDTALQLALVIEIARKVFSRNGSWRPDIRGPLFVSTGACFAIAISLTCFQPTSASYLPQKMIIKGNFLSALLLTGLLVVMLVVSTRAGLNWKTPAAAIGIGMSVWSFLDVLVELMNTSSGLNSHDHLNAVAQTARKISFLCCLGYWSYALFHQKENNRKLAPRREGQVAAITELASQTIRELE